MSGARWTIRVCSGCQTDASQDCRCAPDSGSVDVPVEVMRVAEHEAAERAWAAEDAVSAEEWASMRDQIVAARAVRRAAQAVVDTYETEDPAEADVLERLRAALDNTEEAR